MGKSPGRWIKTVLFGKKYSKSSLSKTAAKTPVENLAGNPPLVTDLSYQLTDRGAENTELETGASGTPCDTTGLYPRNQGVDSQSNFVPVPASDAEMRRQEQSATKAQAAFRGYLARRAFRALKGIIRLQALIRGHLVRRQAVATLRCMRAIIKFQALARGRKVRLSDTWPEGCKKYNIAKLQDATQVDIGANSFLGSEKLATNAFVCKLLVPLPTAVPLSLQYDLAEPNSAWNWLERWSLSHFSEPRVHSKNIMIKPHRKQGGTQIVETGTGKSKRRIRKVSTAVNDTDALASIEIDKPKRNPRKVTSHQTELVQEQPQSELERVKRNLRKVSASAAVASEKSETETEKPQPQPQSQQSMKIVLNFSAPDVSEPKILISSENPSDSDIVADKLALVEAPSKITVMDELVDVPQDDHSVVELHSLENGGKMESPPTLNEESISKEEQTGKENQKIRKRRSLPVKQEYPENILQNTPSLPSYMAATESAKAKLRAQGSSKFDEDGTDYGYVRRHSLPASTNGKLSSLSLSPRIQKPVQANGKGGSKTNRSLTVSRDDKVLQPGWKR